MDADEKYFAIINQFYMLSKDYELLKTYKKEQLEEAENKLKSLREKFVNVALNTESNNYWDELFRAFDEYDKQRDIRLNYASIDKRIEDFLAAVRKIK